MIKAHHIKLADFVFQHYLGLLLKKHFYAIHLIGDIPQFDPSLPLILLPNHSSWWDGFFIYLLNKKVLRRQAYLMMLEEQLGRNRFFRNIGAYSIDPTSPFKTKESIDYTLSLINEESKVIRMVCVFPQGELLPWGKRPMGYKRGIELIFRTMNRSVNLCSLAMKIEFLDQQRPDVFFLFGKNRILKPKTNLCIQDIETDHEILLNSLSKQITNDESSTVIFRGRASVNEAFERIRGKLSQLKSKKDRANPCSEIDC